MSHRIFLVLGLYTLLYIIGAEDTLGTLQKGKKPGVVLIEDMDLENMKLTEKSVSIRLV